MSREPAFLGLVHADLLALIREMSPLERRNFAFDCARFALERTGALEVVSDAFRVLQFDLSQADASMPEDSLRAAAEVLDLVIRHLEDRVLVTERGLVDAWSRIHAIKSIRRALYPASLEAAAGAAFDAWLATQGKEAEAMLTLLRRYVSADAMRQFAASPQFLAPADAKDGAPSRAPDDPDDADRSRRGNA